MDLRTKMLSPINSVKTTQSQDLSVGITYAVRHLKIIFTSLSWAYGSKWGPEAGGNKHEARRDKIEQTLKSRDMYKIIGVDTQITGTAFGYIYRTDNLLETLVNPAKDGKGDWKPMQSLLTKFFDDMERDLGTVNTSLDQVATGTASIEWQWDASREQWYYWCSMDRTYKYQSGMWLRLDGSRTSLAEEIELAKARGIPVKTALEFQDTVYSIVAPMQQLSMGYSETAMEGPDQYRSIVMTSEFSGGMLSLMMTVFLLASVHYSDWYDWSLRVGYRFGPSCS